MRRLAAAIAAGFLLVSAAHAGQRPKRTAKPARPMTVEVTAYCIRGETRSGEPTRKGVIAADPRVLPIGSIVRIEGLRGRRNQRHNGTYTVLDTGREIKGREIDIFMPSCNAAERFGRQPARLRVLRRGAGLEAMKEPEP